MEKQRYTWPEIGQAYLRSMFWADKGSQPNIIDQRILSTHDVSPSAAAREREDIRNYAEEKGLLPVQTSRIMTAATGTSLRPAMMLAVLMVFAELHSVARRLFRPAWFIGSELHIGGITTNITAGWTGQSENALLRDFAYSKGVVKAAKIGYIMPFTREHQEDSIPDLSVATYEACGRANGLLTDQSAFLGDGTDAFGGFVGILPGSSRVVPMAAGKTSIFNTTLDDLKALILQIPSGRRKGCLFFLGEDLVMHLLGMKDTQGRYMLQTDGFGGVTLFGYRIVVVPCLDAIADGPSVKFAAFGDPGMAIFATRSGLEITPSNAGIVLNEAGSLIEHNAIMGDLMLAYARERVAIGLLDASAFAVLQTAAA